MMWVKELFENRFVRRYSVLALLFLILYMIQGMLNILLITFILGYLMERLKNFLLLRIRKVMRMEDWVVVAALYILLVCALIYGIYNIVPIVLVEGKQVIKQFTDFYNQPHSDNKYLNYLVETLNGIDLAKYVNHGFDFVYATVNNVSKWGITFFMGFILSLFYVLEGERVARFANRLETSQIAPIYKEMKYFAHTFSKSFGKIIEVQFLIAFVNSLLSAISLWLMGFPHLLVLSVMIFVLGLIPVAGVFISLIPLCTIAFSIGGYLKVIYVVIMITVLHTLEGYVLNPKFMSAKTDLPIFISFLVLLFSEHYIGVWGLIIGIPVFMFFLDILEVKVVQEKNGP